MYKVSYAFVVILFETCDLWRHDILCKLEQNTLNWAQHTGPVITFIVLPPKIFASYHCTKIDLIAYGFPSLFPQLRVAS